MASVIAFLKSWLQKIIAFFSGKTVVDDPTIDDPSLIDPGEVVCYYGCPNSKKAKKLQLNKTAYR